MNGMGDNHAGNALRELTTALKIHAGLEQRRAGYGLVKTPDGWKRIGENGIVK